MMLMGRLLLLLECTALLGYAWVPHPAHPGRVGPSFLARRRLHAASTAAPALEFRCVYVFRYFSAWYLCPLLY